MPESLSPLEKHCSSLGDNFLRTFLEQPIGAPRRSLFSLVTIFHETLPFDSFQNVRCLGTLTLKSVFNVLRYFTLDLLEVRSSGCLRVLRISRCPTRLKISHLNNIFGQFSRTNCYSGKIVEMALVVIYQERATDNNEGANFENCSPKCGKIVDKCSIPGPISLLRSWKMRGDISSFLTLGARRLGRTVSLHLHGCSAKND